MDIFEAPLLNIDKEIKRIIEKEGKRILSTKKKIAHNHPPTKHLVDGCSYCKSFGNILANIDTIQELNDM